MTRNRSMILLASFVFSISFSAFAQEEAEPAPEARVPRPATITADTINVTFPGGTAIRYVEAVRLAAKGNVNIITMPGVEQVHVPPIRLTQVDADAALNVLTGPELMVQPVQGRHSSARLVYVVRPGYAHQPRVEVRVIPVRDLIERRLRSETILSAIEATLATEAQKEPPLDLTFHKESALLIARGEHRRLELVQQVTEALRKSALPDEEIRRHVQLAEAQARRAEEAAREVDTLQRAVEKRQEEVAWARVEAAETRVRLESMERLVAELEERNRLLRQTMHDHEARIRAAVDMLRETQQGRIHEGEGDRQRWHVQIERAVRRLQGADEN